MPKSNVNNCSQLVRIFALSSCAFLLSDRTQFCSQTVRNFALGPYAILLVDRTQFCSRTVRNFVLRPLLVLIFALKPLLVPATYRATVLDTGVVRLLCNLAGHEGLPDSAISSSFPKSASLRSLMASTILASIFCTEGLNLTGNALCDKNSVTCFNNIGVRWIRG